MLTDFFTRNHVESLVYIVDPQYSDNYREILGTQFQFSYSANWAIKCHMFSNPNRDRLDKCNKGRRKKNGKKRSGWLLGLTLPSPMSDQWSRRSILQKLQAIPTVQLINCSVYQLFRKSYNEGWHIYHKTYNLFNILHIQEGHRKCGPYWCDHMIQLRRVSKTLPADILWLKPRHMRWSAHSEVGRHKWPFFEWSSLWVLLGSLVLGRCSDLLLDIHKWPSTSST